MLGWCIFDRVLFYPRAWYDGRFYTLIWYFGNETTQGLSESESQGLVRSSPIRKGQCVSLFAPVIKGRGLDENHAQMRILWTPLIYLSVVVVGYPLIPDFIFKTRN
jgi:hypothetical protein